MAAGAEVRATTLGEARAVHGTSSAFAVSLRPGKSYPPTEREKLLFDLGQGPFTLHTL
jgi:hypothetical protein